MDRVIQAIGQRVKDLRSQRGLTLEEVAERSGCTPGFLSQIERNKAVPSISMLYAIAEALDTKVSDFFPETIQPARVVRHDDRETFHFEGSSVTYSLLSTKFPHAAIDAFLLKVIPSGGPADGRNARSPGRRTWPRLAGCLALMAWGNVLRSLCRRQCAF